MPCENKLIFGKWEDSILSVPDRSVNLICTDPPYGVIPAKWDHRPDWMKFMSEMARVCGDSGQMWIFCRLPWAIELYLAAIDNQWRWVQERVWEKQNGCGANVNVLRKVHENIWHFKRPKATTFNLLEIREPKMTTGDKSIAAGKGASNCQFMKKRVAYVDDGLRMPKSVIFCPNLHQSKESLGHSTQKPEAVILPLILYSSNPGDLVLDPFAGTGTTLAVARKTGRRWLGMEMTPEWYGKATERLGLPAIGVEEPAQPQGTRSIFGEE